MPELIPIHHLRCIFGVALVYLYFCAADVVENDAIEEDAVTTTTRTLNKVDITKLERYDSLQQCNRFCKLRYVFDESSPLCLKNPKSSTKEYVCCRKITPVYYEKECEDIRLNTTEDVCSSDPCLHGGSCLVRQDSEASASPPGYDCRCKRSYTGKRCETAIELVYRWCIPGQTGNCKYGTCYKLTRERTLTNIVREQIRIFLDINEAQVPSDLSMAGVVEIEDALVDHLTSVLHDTSIHIRGRPPGHVEESVCFCHPGYRGFKCDLECPSRRWGPYCLGTCPEDCVECTPDDGTCLECERGFDLSPSRRQCVWGNCDETVCVHGVCETETLCTCNFYYTGLWCDKSCSERSWPAFSPTCDYLCGRCAVQPCDMVTGECLTLANGTRCMEGFRGDQCAEMDIEGPVLTCDIQLNLMYGIAVIDELYASPDLDIPDYMEDLAQELRENQLLHNEIDAHFMNTFEQELYMKRNVSALSTSTTKKRRHLLQVNQQTPLLQVEISVSVPASDFGSAADAQQYVKKKIKMNSNKFESKVLPELKIDQQSIRTTRVALEHLEKHSGTTAESLNSRYFLAGAGAVMGVLVIASILMFLVAKNKNKKFLTHAVNSKHQRRSISRSSHIIRRL